MEKKRQRPTFLSARATKSLKFSRNSSVALPIEPEKQPLKKKIQSNSIFASRKDRFDLCQLNATRCLYIPMHTLNIKSMGKFSHIGKGTRTECELLQALWDGCLSGDRLGVSFPLTSNKGKYLCR